MKPSSSSTDVFVESTVRACAISSSQASKFSQWRWIFHSFSTLVHDVASNSWHIKISYPNSFQKFNLFRWDNSLIFWMSRSCSTILHPVLRAITEYITIVQQCCHLTEYQQLLQCCTIRQAFKVSDSLFKNEVTTSLVFEYIGRHVLKRYIVPLCSKALDGGLLHLQSFQ